MLAFGMTILIFMIIVMYGNWIAMSVVEEKSSRVMEVVLNAATPFQLLAGKVLGVGGVAFTQYGAVVVVRAARPRASRDPSARSCSAATRRRSPCPAGSRRACCWRSASTACSGSSCTPRSTPRPGSLVSRIEDVNAAVMPMTFLSMGGYFVGVYAALGLLDVGSGVITALAQVPFFSPFMMLGRIAVGGAEPWEIVVSIALLLVAILVAVWVAARIYAAGVLLYGQRPGIARRVAAPARRHVGPPRDARTAARR